MNQMKNISSVTFAKCSQWRRSGGSVVLVLFAIFTLACKYDPRKVDVELPGSSPEVQITSYTQALNDLGLMTEIYETDSLRIQSNPIMDNTGAAQSTGSEIPRDVTEMIKTTLNSIGGRVVFIPYDPSFVQNQMVTQYSSFANKVIPNVVLSGGITEFDRGLVVKGENTDLDLAYEFKGPPDLFPSKNVGIRYGDEAKYGLASITLDFNLLDFETMTGVSKMNAVNTMKVHKAVAGKELSLSLVGQTFGLKGTMKKVQGRHAAVRLLVELSMIQIAGKYLAVPYWRLLGAGALPDKVVLDAARSYYHSLSQSDVVAVIQQWLYLYGHDVPQDGKLEFATKQALQSIYPKYTPTDTTIGAEVFEAVWTNIPITPDALGRRQRLAKILQQAQPQAEPQPAAAQAPAQRQPSVAEVHSATEGQAQTEGRSGDAHTKLNQQSQQKPVRDQAYPETEKTPGNRQGIGRFLSEKEW